MPGSSTLSRTGRAEVPVVVRRLHHRGGANSCARATMGTPRPRRLGRRCTLWAPLAAAMPENNATSPRVAAAWRSIGRTVGAPLLFVLVTPGVHCASRSLHIAACGGSWTHEHRPQLHLLRGNGGLLLARPRRLLCPVGSYRRVAVSPPPLRQRLSTHRSWLGHR